MDKKVKSEWLLSANASIASYLDASLLVCTGIVLATWQVRFGFNTWWVGAISTLVTISVALGSLLGGYLSDRFGRIWVFNIDIFFTFLGTIIVALAPNLNVLLIGIIIAGMASGADLPTSLAVISERTDPKRYGKVIASTEIFWIAGIVLSQGLGFMTAGLGYLGTQLLFIWLGSVALITWAVRVFSPKFHMMEKEMAIEVSASFVTEEEITKVPLRKILSMPRYSVPMLGLIGFYLFWNIPANTWGSFLNYFLVTIDGRSQQFATLTGFFANILGAIVLYGINMKFADTKYRYVMMRVGLVLCTLSFIISAISGGVWLIFTIAYFVYCMANMLHGESIYKIWSQQLYPVNVRASVTGITYAIVRAVTAVFAFVTPVIMSKSPSMLIWILVVSLVVCWLCGESVIHIIKKYKIDDPVYNTK